MRVLLTGGCGFIGSHTAISLMDAGHDAILLDNFSNSQRDVPDRISQIAGRSIPVVEGDIRNNALLQQVFAEQRPDAVIHFAGFKAVAESVAQPLKYYVNNVGGTLSLLEAFPESDFALPAPESFRKMFPTMGSIFILIATHPMMHAGQFVPIRRALGKPIVM